MTNFNKLYDMEKTILESGRLEEVFKTLAAFLEEDVKEEAYEYIIRIYGLQGE